MINPDIFCSAPFKNALIDKDGSLITCCDFMADQSNIPKGHISDFSKWWDQDLQILRNKFINSEQDNGCLHCAKNEQMSNHTNSVRISQNQRAIHPLNFYPTRPTQAVEEFEIRFGNYCNLKCIMCGEYASSSIGTEYIKNQSKYNSLGVFMSTESIGQWWEHKQSLDNVKLMLSSVRRCSFSGGEPLMVPELLEILDILDQSCSLSIITNLTKLSEALLQKLSKFKFVSMLVSCEGIEDHNNYIRFGSKWDVIQENIHRLRDHKNIRININHVLQHTSVFTLPSLIDWCKQQSLPLATRVVYENSYPGPGVLGINSAHPADVEKFKTWLATTQTTTTINTWISQYSYDSKLNNQFHSYMTMLDSIRGTDFCTTFNPTYDSTQH